MMVQFWGVFHYDGPTPDALYGWVAVSTSFPKYNATGSVYGWLTMESPFQDIWRNGYLTRSNNHGILVSYYEE